MTMSPLPLIVDDTNIVSLMAQSAGRLVVKVLDMKGMIAKKLQIKTDTAGTEHKIDLQDLPTGKYVLNAFNGDAFWKCIRFVKH